MYEQASQLREVGAAVALSANGTRLLRRLGLGSELAECSVVPTELIHRHWRDGHRITAHAVGTRYEELFGAPYYGVHRADLQSLLVAACGHERVHLGRRLTDVNASADGVELTFSDGHVTRADVVVGADGVHSTVRGWVTGEDTAAYSATSGFRGLVPAEQLTLLPDPGAIQFWMGPGGHLLHYPIGNGETINFLAVVDGPRTWPANGWMVPTTHEEIGEAFTGWHPAVVQLVSATSLHQRWALFGQSPSNRWSRGRITLLGDAVHAMLPHHGQGANQTIEDAVTLADCLASSEEDTAALWRYETLRRARTRQVQRSSWGTSDALHLPDGPAAARHDRDLADLPNTLHWIHAHDAEALSPTPRHG
ncbi:salicylate hydroxylase [Saccharopolyspora lacisalsi]|uniref:Salicylate hydroxylase n=1 Tax=Halosaccharopolyspora lacisalsi TaxID=1000566 RepID=A0A839DSN3_9PSEU|nr:salicylate hydroxylase [Halosaccharopolyspora lacisalsi]